MAREITLSDDAAPPDPARATTAAEFVDAMRRMKQWTGWGFRQLEKRAAAAGQVLPRSTLTLALTRQTLPREDLIAAFARACGLDENQTGRWIAARRRIAAGDIPVRQPVAPVAAPRRLMLRLTRRLAIVAAVLLVTTIVGAGYLIEPRHPRASGSDQEHPAPAGPPPAEPTTPETPSPEAQPLPPIVPAVVPGTKPPPRAAPPVIRAAPPVDRTPTPPAPPPGTTTPPPPPPAEPSDPGRMVLQRPGGSTVSCPMPYLSTAYAALAQCTESSNGRARIGWYSPFTDVFDSNTGWMKIVDHRWYDSPALATDGISGHARGYATVETPYGPAVWVTQYRDGEGRWGLVNLITGKFYESQGWQPTG